MSSSSWRHYTILHSLQPIDLDRLLVPSDPMVRLTCGRTQPASTVRQTIQQMHRGMLCEIRNEIRSQGRIECVCHFCVSPEQTFGQWDTGYSTEVFVGCLSVFKTYKALQVDLVSLTDVRLADILITMSLSRSTSHSSSSCSSVIKALHWLVKSADVRCLQAVHSILIGTFLHPNIPRDKKQAIPLPLWAFVQWEQRTLMSNCTATEVILLGTFLVMTW